MCRIIFIRGINYIMYYYIVKRLQEEREKYLKAFFGRPVCLGNQ
jgi:hypothetical protein